LLCSINFINLWSFLFSSSLSRESSSTSWESSSTSRETSHIRHSLSSIRVLLVDSSHNWIEKIFEFFLFTFKLFSRSIRILFNEFNTFINFSFNRSFFRLFEFIFEFFIFKRVSDTVSIVFKSIFGINFFSEEFIFGFELFSFFNEFFYVFFGKSSFIVGNCDFLCFS